MTYPCPGESSPLPFADDDEKPFGPTSAATDRPVAALVAGSVRRL